jgi:hypothetical protein
MLRLEPCENGGVARSSADGPRGRVSITSGISSRLHFSIARGAFFWYTSNVSGAEDTPRMSSDARLRVVELALRTAVLVINTESLRSPAGDAQLGFSAVNYGNLFIRDRWTLFAIARELNCSVDELISPPEVRRSGPRWSELTRASEELLAEVQKLPQDMRLVLILRACGARWKQITAKLPGRVFFSIVDDADHGLAQLVLTCPSQVAMLASYDDSPQRCRRVSYARRVWPARHSQKKMLRADQKDAMSVAG